MITLLDVQAAHILRTTFVCVYLHDALHWSTSVAHPSGINHKATGKQLCIVITLELYTCPIKSVLRRISTRHKLCLATAHCIWPQEKSCSALKALLTTPDVSVNIPAL